MLVEGYQAVIGTNEKTSDIEEALLALEKGGDRQIRETLRAEVRNYRDYLVPFRVDQNGGEQVFKISNLYKIESMPIFISEKDYYLFRREYLEKHGHLDEFERRGNRLTLKSLNAEELFDLIPSISLGALFVLSQNRSELLFSFNLAEVFTECFRENATEQDLDYLPNETRAAETEVEGDPDSIEAVKAAASRKIEEYAKYRSLFATAEWIVLISQPTKNKLLKGEFSRDDFDLDRHGDKRIFIFSDAAALEDYKTATGQEEEIIYSVKVDRQRVFGSDLSAYDVIFANPYSPHAVQIHSADFGKLNRLYRAFEIEDKLTERDNARKNDGHYAGVAEHYVGIKKFERFILPIDIRRKIARPESVNLADWVCGAAESRDFPVFTADDCFEAFRLESLETYDAREANFIEPYYLDGSRLFETLVRTKDRKIVLNANGPSDPLAFEPNFSLKVYCA